MIYRGWKTICAALGGMSDDTARRLMREEALPVTMVCGQPMSTSALLAGWVRKKCQEHTWEPAAVPGPAHAD